MCVCVFPDCSILTTKGLEYIGDFNKLQTLALYDLQDGVLSGYSIVPWLWLQGLAKTLNILDLTGEPRGKCTVHTVIVNATWTELTAIRRRRTAIT